MEALAVERLEQVVERVDVEGAQRVVIEGGHEDDERHARGADGFDDFEAAGAGHLHVEKDEVRLQASDGVDRVGAGGALGDELQPVFRREQRAQPLAGQRLVVGDEDAHLAVRHATWKAASPRRRGRLMKGELQPDRQALGVVRELDPVRRAVEALEPIAGVREPDAAAQAGARAGAQARRRCR